MIHSADPQSRPVVIIIFAHVVRSFVRPSVRPLFKSSTTKQQKIMVATGGTVGLVEWFIDDSCLVIIFFTGGSSEEDGGFGHQGEKTRYATLQKQKMHPNCNPNYDTLRSLRSHNIPSLVR